MTGFYLLSRPVPGPRKWYAADEDKRVLVQHISAGAEDLRMVGDGSAEALARYCATTDRAVSWHDGVDTDSIVRLLPPGYTAFHCRGANRDGIGQEISKRNVRWAGMPAAWTAATLHNSAEAWRPHVERYGIPLRTLTAAERERGLKGFLAHSTADPARRSDPGADFPWDRLFTLIAHPEGHPGSPSAGRRTLRLRSPMLRGADVEALQRAIGAVPPDGVFGPATELVLRAWQFAHGLEPDGVCGPATWARLDEETGESPEEDDMPSAITWHVPAGPRRSQPIPPAERGDARWGPGWLSVAAGEQSTVEVDVVQEDGQPRRLFGGPAHLGAGQRRVERLQAGDHVVLVQASAEVGCLVEYGRAS